MALACSNSSSCFCSCGSFCWASCRDSLIRLFSCRAADSSLSTRECCFITSSSSDCKSTNTTRLTEPETPEEWLYSKHLQHMFRFTWHTCKIIFVNKIQNTCDYFFPPVRCNFSVLQLLTGCSGWIKISIIEIKSRIRFSLSTFCSLHAVYVEHVRRKTRCFKDDTVSLAFSPDWKKLWRRRTCLFIVFFRDPLLICLWREFSLDRCEKLNVVTNWISLLWFVVGSLKAAVFINELVTESRAVVVKYLHLFKEEFNDVKDSWKLIFTDSDVTDWPYNPKSN